MTQEKRHWQAEWDRRTREVATLQDNLGTPVDHHIRPVIVALRANGFPTFSSCEGHLDRPLWYPYALLHAGPASSDFPDVERWRAANASVLRDTKQLLRNFYSDRAISQPVKLRARTYGPYNVVEVASSIADRLAGVSSKERSALLVTIREEFDALSDFLKEQLLSKGPLRRGFGELDH